MKHRFYFVSSALATWLGLFIAVSPCWAGEPPPGFKSLFNGNDLAGWEGDAGLWAVKDGVITGTGTTNNPLPYNKFLIWRGGTVQDFELRATIRMTGNNNSGFQYRSVERKELGEFVVSGYQADVHPRLDLTGMFYEERGRGLLARRGQKATVHSNGKAEVTGSLIKPGEALQPIDLSQWNEFTVIARGNYIIHKVNDETVVEAIDQQKEKAAESGILAIQLHSGAPMEVQIKDIFLKVLPPQ